MIEEMTEEGPELLSAIEIRANPDTWRLRFHDRYRMIYQVSKDRKQSTSPAFELAPSLTKA